MNNQLIRETYPDDARADDRELARAWHDGAEIGDDATIPMGRFEWALHDLYHATVDALTEPMPELIARMNDLSTPLICELGFPVLGKALGERVQAWRNTAHAAAVETLRNVLVTIESEMK